MAAPVARTEVVRDTYFGVTVEDPYRWLEDAASDEVRAWLEGQAAHARSVLDGLGPRADVLARVAELRGHGPERSGFAAAGGAVFHRRQEPGAGRSRPSSTTGTSTRPPAPRPRSAARTAARCGTASAPTPPPTSWSWPGA